MSSTPYIIGGIALLVAGGYLWEQSHLPTQAAVVTTSGGTIPTNINDLMLNAWQSAGRPGLVNTATGRDLWIRAMLPLLPTLLDYGKWGLVYDQVEGYYARQGVWAGSDTVFGWVKSSAGL